MSDTEDHDFDLSKLARKLSISSEDWQSDSSSQSGQRHSGPASNDAPGESYASDNAPPDKPRYDISASIPPRSSSKPHGVPSSTEAALTTPALSRESSPRSPFDLSSVSETPKAIKVNTSLTGLGLSSANDPLWPQTFDKSPGSLSALHPPYATTGAPVALSSHSDHLVESPLNGHIPRARPSLTSRKTVAASSPQPEEFFGLYSYTNSPPQYAGLAPWLDDEAASQHLKEKRKSLRSSLAWDDSTDGSSSVIYRTSTGTPNATHPSLNGPASPRHGPLRSPSVPQRPSLTRPASSSFSSVGGRDRSSSLGRRVSNHSRSSSRASMHMSASASPIVQRRISSYRSSPSYIKGKALSLEPSELIEVLKEEHHRILNEATSSEIVHKSRPLVIDTRPLPDYLGSAGRIKGSINCNFPSLLIKRFKRGKIANFTLESFITTEAGKLAFKQAILAVSHQSTHQHPEQNRNHPMPSPEGSSSKALADLDLFIVDESIDQLDGTSTGSILVSVLEQVTEGQVGRGSLCYLHGRVASLASLPAAVEVIVHGEGDELSDLQSQRTPDLEASPDIVQKPHNAKHLLIQSPPRVSAASVLQPVAKAALDSSPRPSRRPSRAQLKKLDTSESLQAYRSSGSSALSHRSESLEAGTSRPNSRTSNISLQELCRIQSSSPRNTPLNSTLSSQVSSPVQAAHSNLQSTEVFKTRAPSPISPGPEPQTKEDMAQLKDLGIHQILNMALEIDEGDMGRQFEKYVKIPMRDFVDETGVQGRIDEACALLDDADLKSKSVYVHCRAGKSRSVTIVLAYLIHRYHWTLSRAYEHVAEKRKGISPNIGFMSELMRFEERALGTKSSGVNLTSSLPTSGPSSKPPTATRSVSSVGDPGRGMSAQNESAWGRLRDSMPPMNTSPTDTLEFGQLFSGDREQEVKGHNGAWVHARRDQMTERFQPNRRASKAGLESNLGE